MLEERRVWEFYRGIVREDGIDVQHRRFYSTHKQILFSKDFAFVNMKQFHLLLEEYAAEVTFENN